MQKEGVCIEFFLLRRVGAPARPPLRPRVAASCGISQLQALARLFVSLVQPPDLSRSIHMDDLSDLTSALAEEELAATLSSLSESSPDVADELEALSAIYDASTPSLTLYTSSPSPSHTPSRSHSPTLRLVLHTTVPTTPPHPLSLLLSLPATYPIEAPPLLQLHSRYIGSDHVTDELFGEVVRVFMHDEETGEGVVWRAGEVCLYEGVEWVRERCVKWCGEREGERKRLEVVRRGVGVYAIGGAVQTGEGEGEWEVWGEDGRDAKSYVDEALARRRVREEAAQAAKRTSAVVCPRIVSAEPILDRKSVSLPT